MAQSGKFIHFVAIEVHPDDAIKIEQNDQFSIGGNNRGDYFLVLESSLCETSTKDVPYTDDELKDMAIELVYYCEQFEVRVRDVIVINVSEEDFVRNKSDNPTFH